jgi:hypothetical protein
VPWGHSLASTLRAGVWKMFRAVFKFWNLAEFGSAGSGVFTRVFVISGVKVVGNLGLRAAEKTTAVPYSQVRCTS